jgi:hypothetical protein
MIDPNALIAGLADVTDGGVPKEEEIKQPLEIEESTPAENTFLGCRNIRAGIFRQHKAAISTRKIPFRSPELKAISRIADGARYEYFPLNIVTSFFFQSADSLFIGRE